MPDGPIELSPVTQVDHQPAVPSDASTVLRHDTRARFIIGIVVIVQFVALIAFIQYSNKQLPDSQLILGAEISFVTIILNFFFGSSSGSVTKSAKGESGNVTQPAR